MADKQYNIGEYEIHPTTPEELQKAIEINFSIAQSIIEEGEHAGLSLTDFRVHANDVVEELRSKVTDLVRYFIDHQ